MISLSYARSTMSFARASILLATSACLTACSPLLADVNNHANFQPPQEEAQKASLPASEITTSSLPDMPPDLVKCIDRRPKAGKTADEKVTALSQTAEQRRACMKAMLDFYRKIQAAEKARKRTASADPPTIKPLSP